MSGRRGFGRLPALLAALLASAALRAQEEGRFPRPEFESGYVPPVPADPPLLLAWLVPAADALVLLAMLLFTAWLVLVRRSRRAILLVAALAGVGWFGFVRRGCICPVGGIQNVAEALVQGSGVPVAVTLMPVRGPTSTRSPASRRAANEPRSTDPLAAMGSSSVPPTSSTARAEPSPVSVALSPRGSSRATSTEAPVMTGVWAPRIVVGVRARIRSTSVA